MFLKEVLKKLRNKLLIKVLEKQDELAIKTEDLTELTLMRLSEVRQSVKTSADIQTELWASLERANAKAASKQEAVELKTVINALQADVEKTLSAVARVQTELQASLEKATASAVSKQEATELKVEIKTLKVDAEKTLTAVARIQTELQASLEKANAEQPSPVSLKAEKGLQNYLRLLKSLSKRYMILIAVRDTTGAFLTDDIATGIKALGFTVDLSFEKGLKKQHHHSYVGVIDRGQVVCEAVSKQKETTYYMATREGVFYEVVSKSYPEGNVAVIKIDGVDYATNRRGLNIVVFDPITKTVIDSVCFDTHIATLICSRFEDAISSIKRKLDALFLSGYTVPQYCIDNKITNVVIYSESEYWNIAENICISFWLNRKVSIRKFCATRLFIQQPLDNNMPFPVSNFISMNDVKLIMDDTVLIIHPNPQTDLIKRFEAYGARVITLNQIVADMYNIRMKS
jgi:hypothetical protein